MREQSFLPPALVRCWVLEKVGEGVKVLIHSVFSLCLQQLLQLQEPLQYAGPDGEPVVQVSRRSGWNMFEGSRMLPEPGKPKRAPREASGGT